MDTQKSKKILVVDDEAAVRTLLRECFELDGHTVAEASNSNELDARLAERTPDLITLDLNLGGENGLDLAGKIRAQSNVPIIMITGKGDTIDRVVGLELGADDYIAKPFHVREVLARARAVLRRYESLPEDRGTPGPAGERYTFGDWVLGMRSRELESTNGDPRDITTSEFNMLAMFVTRPGQVLSRDGIMDVLKGHDWSPMDRSIDALVVRVRKKIEVDPAHPTLIKTVRGVGYVFAGEVSKT